MKDKIKKLLKSSIYEDVLLGVELSFDLPIEEFKDLFPDNYKFNCNFFGKIHRFGRELTDYHITSSDGKLLKYSPPNYAHTKKGLSKHTYPGWVNLGYKEN